MKKHRSRNAIHPHPSESVESFGSAGTTSQASIELGSRRHSQSQSAAQGGHAAEVNVKVHYLHPVHSESKVVRIEKEIQRLKKEENTKLHALVRSGHRGSDLERLKEKYFHLIMDQRLKLPLEHSETSASVRLKRMGTVRHNVMNEEEVEYPVRFCKLLLFVWVVVFAAEMYQNDWAFEHVDKNPMLGPSLQTLEDMGGLAVNKVVNSAHFWRFVTPLFLHAGLIHLAVDAAILYRLGWAMETSFGTWRVAVIWVVSGAFGNCVTAIFVPDTLNVGASCALFGWLGALYGDFIDNYKWILEGKCVYFTELVLATAMGFAVGLLPMSDNFGHLGGWLFGIVSGIAYLAGAPVDHDGRHLTTWYTKPLVLLSFMLQTAMWLTALTILFSATDVNGWCTGCRKFSCMPTDYWDCDVVLRNRQV